MQNFSADPHFSESNVFFMLNDTIFRCNCEDVADQRLQGRTKDHAVPQRFEEETAEENICPNVQKTKSAVFGYR